MGGGSKSLRGRTQLISTHLVLKRGARTHPFLEAERMDRGTAQQQHR